MTTFIGDPPGTLKAYAGGSSPLGYLMCDGLAVSRSTYAALWTTIGTTYGVGDGSTTFNVPDMRGRMPVGVGSHADVSALGNNDGATLADRRVKHKHSRAGSASMTGVNSSLALGGSNSSIGLGGSNSSISLPGGAPDGGVNNTGAFQTGGIGQAWKDGNIRGGGLGGANSDLFLSGSNSSLGLSGANSTVGVSDTITIGPQTNVPTDGPAFVTFNYIIKV